ncbi:hypothetical protein JTE90_029256 [Oedothorax gibbosus]|uniref:Uncharacterized protein n=1 Tax=Oedothorax gibbosus TaxID=931172 RepID=A0AAV6TWN8_9ARAC|nr:hypothetical protein JTE90_029256 [Oedothorax gibbosus]
MALLLEALKLGKSRDLIKDSVCDAGKEACMLSLCLNCANVYDSLKSKIPEEDHSLYMQWKKVEGRLKIVDNSGSMLDAADEVASQFQKFKKHCFVKDVQDGHFQSVKGNLVEVDESTDASSFEKFIMYVKFIDSDATTKFLALRNVESGTADALKSLLLDVLKEFGIDLLIINEVQKKRREIQELSEIMAEEENSASYSPKNIQGTRWIDHKKRAA